MSGKDPAVRLRAWCWTLNLGKNKDAAMAYYQIYREGMKKIHFKGDWHVYQLECGKEGEYHVQGASHFKEKISLQGVKDWMGLKQLHVEQMWDKTFMKARRYCTKEKVKEVDGIEVPDNSWIDGTQEEFGEVPRQGARSDLKEIKDKIDEGASYKILYNDHFGSMVRYRKAFDQYAAEGQKEVPLNWVGKTRYFETPLDVVVHWGTAGTGKTRDSKTLGDQCGIPYYWRSGSERQWMDGYMGEKLVVLDEFEPSEVPINVLKVWLDRYPCVVSGKTMKAVPLLAEHWIITAQKHPKEWYPNASKEDTKALMRRLGRIYEFAAVPESDPMDWNDM